MLKFGEAGAAAGQARSLRHQAAVAAAGGEAEPGADLNSLQAQVGRGLGVWQAQVGLWGSQLPP